MNLKAKYDETNPLSIENYSKELINQTFNDVLLDFFADSMNEYAEKKEQFNNPRRKGSLGNLIEEYFFGYTPNNLPEPDFPKAGVELKVTPYEITKSGKVRAGERLVLSMISNTSPVSEVFEESAVYHKLSLMLIILYLRDKEIERIDYPIHYSQLVSMESELLQKDIEIIKSDYQVIIDKIKIGKAHELSEADTMYLGACTKGATAKRSLQPQYYNPGVLAKRRAFSLKQGYMTSFLNKYIIENAITYDEIIDVPVSKEQFEIKVLEKIENYKGFTEDKLRKKFNLEYSSAKDVLSKIVLKILDVKSDNAEEFEKSNTQVKTIRIEKDESIKESMSFPKISFKEFVNEEWEESYVYNYFSETRFLFIIFNDTDEGYVLKDAIFWHMPMKDLEEIGHGEWLKAQNEIRNGVKFQVSGNRIFNSLPNASETEIFHLRPHANRSAYLIQSLNYAKGNIQKDADELPNGDFMTAQCFWLKNEYIKKQLELNKKGS